MLAGEATYSQVAGLVYSNMCNQFGLETPPKVENEGRPPGDPDPDPDPD